MKRDTFTEVERARSALQAIDPGCDRETWVRVAMGVKAAGLSFEDFDGWSSTAANYTGEADCRSVWNSITPGAVTAASLFRIALAHGWSEGEKPATARQTRPRQRKVESPVIVPVVDVEVIMDCTEAMTDKRLHPYVVKKRGNPAGMRVYHGPLQIAGRACNGALVLPVVTLDGELASLQFVTDDGKLFLPGRKLPPDACLIVGTIEAGKPAYLAEGIGQAWSAHKATGCAAVVCFGWGRVSQVAEAISARHPAARLVVVPDAGKETQAGEIARTLNCQFVELPPGTPRNGDINDIEQAEGIEAVRRLLASAKSAPQRFQLLTAAQVATMPPLRWRIKGVLPLQGIAALYGPSGSGKSFLALDMLAAMAAGRDWFGRRTSPCKVMYLALEGEGGIPQRINAYQMKHGVLPDGFHFLLQALDIRNPADRADLIEAARAIGFHDGVLVIDTLNRAAPGADENSSAAMGEIIAAAKAIQHETKGLILLVHHTGKDQAQGLRGHSSLHAALDAAVVVTRDGERREWSSAKSKDGADDQAHEFRLETVEVGTDADGEPITSCVIAVAESTGEPIRRSLPPKSGNQKLIWDSLGKLFRAAGCFAPEGSPKELPAGRPCLRLDDAIAATRSSLLCDPKRQTERTQSAISGLVSHGLLVHIDGWLWCA